MGRRLLDATARGVLCGAIGGGAGALLDYALGAGEAARFLPDGAARLALFLVGLYGATGAIAGGLVGLVVCGLARTTALGVLLRADGVLAASHNAAASHNPAAANDHAASHSGAASHHDAASLDAAPADAAARPRLLASLLATAGALGLVGLAVRQVALFSQARFHSPLLIAALVGLSSAGLAVPCLATGFALAAALSAALPVGPVLAVRARAPVAVVVLAWLVGLALGGAAVGRVFFALQHARRLGPALRALDVALAAAPILLVALAVGHVAVRGVGPRLRAGRAARALSSPLLSLYLPSFALGLGALAIGVVEWPLVKLLPVAAAAVVAVAALVGLTVAIVAAGGPLARRPAIAIAAVLAVPALLFAAALEAGRADRVRKAAPFASSLSATLLEGLHAAWDLDRDGYSPLLGADCNDLDADVHPGAFDWPDDGIDQNCNGHDATLAKPPRPPFPSLPSTIPARPNVLLVTIDALRADHVGAYGYARPTTPRIDELSRESVRFANGWAHSPSTRYSVPAILTGRYESTIAWGSPRDHWPPRVLPENRLLSELFKDHGYHTGAILPSHYFEPGWGLTQGFDDYDNSLASLHGNVAGDPARATGSSSRQVADHALAWLEAAGKRPQPFFLWLHFYDPHYLYEKHPEVTDFGNADVDLYDNEIRYTDLHIGRVLDALRAAGRWDDTVVILTADHGEGFGEHGVSQHGYHIYVQQNKVPFLVKVPGVRPAVAAEPAGHVDLFPTLVNLLRAPDEPQLFGRSLFDLLLGQPDAAPRLVYQEVDYEGPTSRKGVASRTHQLIANVVPDGTYELYDLAHDPTEAHDLFVRGAGGESGRLFAALGAWMDEIALPDDFQARLAGNVASQQIAFDQPLAADLGGLLAIDGVTAVTKEVPRGGEAEIDLVLRAAAKIPVGWRLFTHARARDGYFLNLDHDPVSGLIPLSRLRPGQWVRDRVRFTVPATWPGDTVSLEVGLFRGGERAPAHGGGARGDHVVAAEVAIAPARPTTPAPAPTTP